MELEITVGNGEVCDALECAVLEMRRHEFALVRCWDTSLCAGGAPFESAELPEGGAVFKVGLLDYKKGPNTQKLNEEDRIQFVLRRKAMAHRLLGEGRYYLARERYLRCAALFFGVDRKKSWERLYGMPELRQKCKDLRTTCWMNAALCSLKLGDPKHAKVLCDMVLQQTPECTKALFRRAQAHCQRSDFVQARLDLVRVLDIDGTVEEAKVLLSKVRKYEACSDRE